MMLLLLLLTVCCFGICGGDENYEVVCYGRTYRFLGLTTFQLFKEKLYLTPSDGGPKRLLVHKGKVIHPRIKLDNFGFSLQNVQMDDEGYFTLETDDQQPSKTINIRVSDCVEDVRMNYAESYEHQLKRPADFVEFSPAERPNQSIVLWNVSNAEFNANSRGKLEYSSWKMTDLTQNDNGFYRFWNQDNNLTEKLHLTVTVTQLTSGSKYLPDTFTLLQNSMEHVKDFQLDEDDQIYMVYPCLSHMRTVTFTPAGNEDLVITIKDGRVQPDYWFSGRIQLVINGIEIFRAESRDSGVFEFRDSDDNLIMIVNVVVKDYFILDVIYYTSIGLLIPAMVVMCCCYFCIKKRYKGIPPTLVTSASPVVYHPGLKRSATPTSSAVSYQTVNVTKAKVPAASSSDSPVVPAEKQEPAPNPQDNSNVGPSDNEPMLEQNGVSSPSAPFLNSDPIASDVYTSDKLNIFKSC